MSNQVTYQDKVFQVGDTIQVNYRLIEKEIVTGRAKREKKEEIRERVQAFEGIVIGIRGSGDNKSFTVRRIAQGSIGVERIFPLISPWIKDIKVKKQAKVRRAKLYYLREKVGKEAEKLKEKKPWSGSQGKQKPVLSTKKRKASYKIKSKSARKPSKKVNEAKPKKKSTNR